MGFGPVKGKDGATSLGPVLVTPDELEPHRTGNGFDLARTASVNGVPVGGGTWADIHWSFGAPPESRGVNDGRTEPPL